MIGLKQQLESIIQQEYGLQEEEWVQIDISKRGKVHVTIVTEQQITTEEIKEIIKRKIDEIHEGYTIGFVDIYSIEQAKELGVEHVEPVQSVHNWEDTLYATSYVTAEDKNQIISFYSYKGGVGRTIALIQTAYNLAKAGKRVMMLDLDIEAPSLHKIFEKEVQNEKFGIKYGIVDYMTFSMMENVGKKKFAVAMSKIVASEFGKEKAKELFAQLKMKQERLIPIYYSTDVALSNTFPITSESATQAYGELSKYILDNDLILANRNYLRENKMELLSLKRNYLVKLLIGVWTILRS